MIEFGGQVLPTQIAQVPNPVPKEKEEKGTLHVFTHKEGLSHFTTHPLKLRKGPYVHYVTCSPLDPNLDLREDKQSLGLTKNATTIKKKHYRNYTKGGSQKAWRTSMNTNNLDPNTNSW
jgi:hypothetical protein